MTEPHSRVSDLIAPPGDVADPARLAALESYRILDTAPEEGFDDAVAVAAEVCHAPVALVSFVSIDRQWFKANIGLESCETPLDQSVCAHALKERDILIIPDLASDHRTARNPLVTNGPRVRFYAGVVLKSPEGQALGTLCVLDVDPRPDGLTDGQVTALRALGRQVMALLALRRSVADTRVALIEQARAKRESDAAITAAKASELKFRLAVEATRIGIFDYDPVSGRLEWDERVRELFGAPAEGDVTYEKNFLGGLHPDDRAVADLAVQAALDPHGLGEFEHEYRVVVPETREVRWIAAKGRAVAEGGLTLRFVGTVRDITARRIAEEGVTAALDRYRLVGKVTNDAIWDWDLRTDHVLWNEALTTAYGYQPDEVDPTPLWWVERIHPDDAKAVFDDIRAVIEGAQYDWIHEYRFRRADGRYADVLDRGSIIRDGAGLGLRMIGAMVDETERKAADERQKLLSRELSHRMKNLLTVVQAIASQTMRAASSLADAQSVLSGRLVALSRAHDILLDGTADAGRLATIVASATELLVDRGGRVSAEGPNILVGSTAALPIMLLLHELGTNAVKYGALSAPEGRIEISWSLTEEAGVETFRLDWRESGGPPVAPPQRKGFGTKLIERGLPRQIDGKVRIDYAREGLTCVLESPAARLRKQR